APTSTGSDAASMRGACAGNARGTGSRATIMPVRLRTSRALFIPALPRQRSPTDTHASRTVIAAQGTQASRLSSRRRRRDAGVFLEPSAREGYRQRPPACGVLLPEHTRELRGLLVNQRYQRQLQ